MNFSDFNAMVESNAANLRSSWRNYSLSSSALVAVIVFGGDHLDGKRPMMVFAILGVNLLLLLSTVGRPSNLTPRTCTVDLSLYSLGVEIVVAAAATVVSTIITRCKTTI